MRKTALFVLSLAAALACTGCSRDTVVANPNAGDGGTQACARPCGEGGCCSESETCHEGACCTPDCTGRACGSDGCGGSCGECDLPFACDPETFTCACTQTDEEFCDVYQRSCGPLSAADACGIHRTVASCGDCLPVVERCEENQGSCVVCVGETEEELCETASLECGPATLTDECGATRSIESCGECTGHHVCQEGHCALPPLPPNDACETAFLLALNAEMQIAPVHGTTYRAHDDSSGGCAWPMPHDGPDVVYLLELPFAYGVTASVRPDPEAEMQGTFLPALYLRPACAGPLPDVACANPDSEGRARITHPNLGAGTYYLIVDGLAGTSGDFILEVALKEAQTNETCENALPLPWDNEGKAQASGDTCAAQDDEASGCGGAEGKDLVYFFEIGEVRDVTVVLSPGHTNGSVLSVRASCADAVSELLCNNRRSTSNTLKLRNLAAGTYYVWVDNAANACGQFTLELVASEPKPYADNDVCAGALAIPIDAETGIGTVSGTTDDGTDGGHGSCRPGSGPDLVYSLELTEPHSVSVTLSPKAGSLLYPVLYLRQGCDGTPPELACRESSIGTSVTVSLPRLEAGTYYVFVDSYTPASTGEFELEVKLTPAGPPPNDRCADAIDLSFDSTGKASVTGNTAGGNDDEASFCSTSSNRLVGPDVVYRFTLDEPAEVTARLARGSSTSYRPAVSLRTSCAPQDEVACARDTSGSSEVTASLPSGTHYVFVDGVAAESGGATGSGPFTLELTRGAFVAGDDCGSPEPLPFDSTTRTYIATGTLDGTHPRAGGTCRSSGSGADRVYTLTLASDQAVTVTLAPAEGTSALFPHVYMRRVCADPASELGCAFSSSAAPATFTLNRVPAGTYYVWVDTYSAGREGAFELKVETAEPGGPAPVNDSCAQPQLLTLHAQSRSVRVEGDTTWAANDLAGGCAAESNPHSGGDLVYELKLEAPAWLYAMVHKDLAESRDFNPAVYLRGDCGSAAPSDEVACATSTTYEHGTGLVQMVPAGTWYLVVDGGAGTFGRFVLDVVARETPVGGNDACGTEEVIALDASGYGAVAGDTRPAANDSGGTCQGSSASDVVYRFEIDSPKDVLIDVSPGQGFAPAVYLRSDCAQSATQRACAYSSTRGGGARLAVTKLPKGTWYLWVDGNAKYEGPFVLQVLATDPPPPPAWNECRGAKLLSFEEGRASVEDDTTYGEDLYRGRCHTASVPHDGPDLVYAFVLDGEAAVTATATPTGDAGLRPAVYIRRECDSDLALEEPACGVAASAGSVATATASLPAGTYFVIMDGAAGTFGAFKLELTLSAPAPGDTCLGAKVLTFNDEGVAELEGDTGGAANSGDGTCNTPSSADLVYAFTLGEESTVQVEVKPASNSSLRPAIYVRGECADAAPGNQYLCARSTTAAPISGKIARLPQGTWYLWVDGSSTSKGAFTGTVTATPAPPVPRHDVCAGALPLRFEARENSEVAELTDETWFALDDTAGTCESSGGPDLVYSISTGPEARKMVATVTRDAGDPSYMPVVYLRTTCDDPADDKELSCAKQSWGVSTVTVNRLEPNGTYFLWVDGRQSGATDTPGKFSLTVTLTAAEPILAGESCANPIRLELPPDYGTTTVNGTTLGAYNEAGGTCVTTTGVDLVYQFTLTKPAKVAVKLTTNKGSGYKPMVYLRSRCGDVGSQQACASRSSEGDATATANYLREGTYWIWVDSYSSDAASSGPYSLEVATSSPAAPASNDLCDGAKPLTEEVVENGNTSSAMNDYTWGTSTAPGCAPPPNANSGRSSGDLVYSYTPTEDGPFKVVMTASWDAALWVGTGACGDTSACVGGSDYGNPESVTVADGRAGVTYWIYADGRDAAGAFSLLVTRL